jgi:succinate dehydrogenase/fumarate reductase flavoprotein subunit
METSKISRRAFLSGSILAGAGVAVAGLAGCSPKSSSSTDSTSTSSSTRPFGYMCDEDWLGSAPEIADSAISATYTADVVVIGGGHAGTQAALAAAQQGATVAVIETHEDGNITYRGDDICSYNSSTLEGWGFGPYNLEDIVNEYVRRANGRCNTDVIRTFVYNSGEMFDNLVSITPSTSNWHDYAGGQCIVQIGYNKPNGSYYPVEVEGYKMWASTCQTVGTKNTQPVGKSGLTGVTRLTEIETYSREAAEDLGATWYCGQTAQTLTQDSTGKVTGVITQSSDGSYVKFSCNKGVILSTGDFGHNADMIWELCSEVMEYAERVGVAREKTTGMTDCVGTGHKLGCWAGGMIETHPRPIAVNCPNLGMGPWGTTPCLWLNSNGARFMNESMAGLALVQSLHQPMGDISNDCNFAIMDSKHLQYIQAAGLDHGAPNWGMASQIADYTTAMNALDANTGSGSVPGLEIASANSSSYMNSTVYVGATAEKALQNAGFSSEVVTAALASLKRYNAFCTEGVDEDYGKNANCLIPIDEGPFYVGKQSTSGLYNCGLNTITGLIVDGDLRVLNVDRTEPIEGLYAAGNCMGQRYGNAYNCPSAGNNMGNAMTTGRVAGKNCAKL